MAEHTPETERETESNDVAVASQRRSHAPSRLIAAIAGVALVVAGYAVWRSSALRDQVDQLTASSAAYASERELLRAELIRLDERTRLERSELETRLKVLADVPEQLQQLATATAELRGRSQGPERSWSRAEALYLLELAQRRLALNYDIDTAIAALEAADARLVSARDESFAKVRQQIATELRSLHALELPDIPRIGARLSSLEDQASALRVKGILMEERHESVESELPAAALPRAWSVVRNAFTGLIRVRHAQGGAGGVITQSEGLMRRAHLQLLLSSARAAVARHDSEAYRVAIASARKWLAEGFDLNDATVQSVLKELQVLEPIDVRPVLPDISGSSATLKRLMPGDAPASPTRGAN